MTRQQQGVFGITYVAGTGLKYKWCCNDNTRYNPSKINFNCANREEYYHDHSDGCDTHLRWAVAWAGAGRTSSPRHSSNGIFVIVHRVRPPPAAGGQLEERVPQFVSVQTEKREGPRRQHAHRPLMTTPSQYLLHSLLKNGGDKTGSNIFRSRCINCTREVYALHERWRMNCMISVRRRDVVGTKVTHNTHHTSSAAAADHCRTKSSSIINWDHTC